MGGKLMAERVQWGREAEGVERMGLFVLASELEPGLEGRRQRLEEKLRMLLSAGVLLSGGCEEAPRDESEIYGPAPAYPQGVFPATGSLHRGA
jgi:hypothetical protein